MNFLLFFENIKLDENQLYIDFSTKSGERIIAGIEISPKQEIPNDVAQTDDPRLIPDRFLLK